MFSENPSFRKNNANNCIFYLPIEYGIIHALWKFFLSTFIISYIFVYFWHNLLGESYRLVVSENVNKIR